MKFARSLAAATLIALAGGTVFAQDSKPATPPDAAAKQPAEKAEKAEKTKSSKLSVGDAAPAIEVERFLKGEPVTGYEKNKVYVVEFWATWCGPCIQAMPHISKLQKQYKDKVTIVGVNIWEEKQYTDETLGTVQKFVMDQGDRMGYTVAYDGPAKKMDKAFMQAAGKTGIPCAFVVDGAGKIAYIGHPMMLDGVLAEVVAGTWDAKEGPKKLEAAMRKAQGIMRKGQTDAKKALEEWAAFEKEQPALASMMADAKLGLLRQADQWPEVYKILNARADEAIATKDAQALNAIAWNIVDPEQQVKQKDLDLAMRAATKAAEFTKNEDGAILDTLARVYFCKGDVAKAIELQKQAVAKAPEGMKDQLQPALDEYEAAAKKPAK